MPTCCFFRLSIDLSSFSHDETVQHWYHLENAPDDAQVLLLITVSGSHGAGETIETDEFNYNDIRNTRIQKYDVTNSFSDLADVGTLTVKRKFILNNISSQYFVKFFKTLSIRAARKKIGKYSTIDYSFCRTRDNCKINIFVKIEPFCFLYASLFNCLGQL